MKLFEIARYGAARDVDYKWTQQGTANAWWLMYNGKNIGPFDSMDAATLYKKQKGFSSGKVVPGTGNGPTSFPGGTNIQP